MTKITRFWIALLFVFCGLMLIWFAMRRNAPMAGATAEHPDQPVTVSKDRLQEFTFHDQMANAFSSKSLEGKYWLASFFFTSCPSVCPALNQKIQELQREFGPQGVEFVSITCDPANDTSTQLYEYAKRFQADPAKWHFLTGEMPYISRVAQDFFQVSVKGVTHSDRLILMDPAGKIVDTYRSRDPVEFNRLKQKLTRVLATPSTPQTPAKSEEAS